MESETSLDEENEEKKKEPTRWSKIKKHIKKNKNKYGAGIAAATNAGIAAATNIASTAMIWTALRRLEKQNKSTKSPTTLTT
jgi:hypothetical protein